MEFDICGISLQYEEPEYTDNETEEGKQYENELWPGRLYSPRDSKYRREYGVSCQECLILVLPQAIVMSPHLGM